MVFTQNTPSTSSIVPDAIRFPLKLLLPSSPCGLQLVPMDAQWMLNGCSMVPSSYVTPLTKQYLLEKRTTQWSYLEIRCKDTKKFWYMQIFWKIYFFRNITKWKNKGSLFLSNILILFGLYYFLSFLCYKTYSPAHVRSIIFCNFVRNFGF